MVKPHYGYAKTESAVKRKLREYKKEVAKGNFETQDSYMLFQDYCLDWLNSVYKNKVIVTTFSERMRTYNRYILNQPIGKVTLNNLTQKMIQKHINSIIFNKKQFMLCISGRQKNNMFVQNVVIPKYLEEEKEIKEREV